MYLTKRTLKTAALCFFLSTTVMTPPAFAFDATSYVEKYQKMAADSGLLISQRAIEPIGSAGFALLDVELASKTDKDMKPVKISRIEVTGIKELEGSSFAADGIRIEGLSWESTSKKGETVVLNMDRAEAVGAYYPDPLDLDAPMVYFDNTTLETTPLSLTVDGKGLASLGSITASNNSVGSKLAGVTSAKINDIFFDLTAIDDPNFEAQREAIGYDKINMNIALAGDYNLETGDMSITEYSIAGDEIGKINMTAAIGGYDLETAKKVKQWGIDNQGKSEKEMQAAMITLLPALGTVTIKSAALQFDDASITNRVLSMQAAKMGKETSEIANMVPTMAMIGLSQLGNPAFAGAVAAALGDFLSKPGNLKIEAQPEKPVSIPELIAIGSTAPQELLDRLGVQVQANK